MDPEVENMSTFLFIPPNTMSLWEYTEIEGPTAKSWVQWDKGEKTWIIIFKHPVAMLGLKIKSEEAYSREVRTGLPNLPQEVAIGQYFQVCWSGWDCQRQHIQCQYHPLALDTKIPIDH
jgi:hypothetical protein